LPEFGRHAKAISFGCNGRRASCLPKFVSYLSLTLAALCIAPN
jgi:hypothetical protein